MKWLPKVLWRRSSSTIQPPSKNVAKERLKLALTYDRGGLARGTIEQLRDEIIQLIAKHLAIRKDAIQIHFERTIECDKLIASIPLLTPARPQIGHVTAPRNSPPRRRRRRRRPAH